MRVVEHVSVNLDLDPYLSLKALAGYSGLSVRSLRGFLSDPVRPLPAYRPGGKILVRRSEFDRWIQAFRYAPDVDRIVDEVVTDLSRQSPKIPT